jgi:hypothetical protein
LGAFHLFFPHQSSPDKKFSLFFNEFLKKYCPVNPPNLNKGVVADDPVTDRICLFYCRMRRHYFIDARNQPVGMMPMGVAW